MNEAQTPSNSECYTPSSEPTRIYHLTQFKELCILLYFVAVYLIFAPQPFSLIRFKVCVEWGLLVDWYGSKLVFYLPLNFQHFKCHISWKSLE
jgi:hypothetical protein